MHLSISFFILSKLLPPLTMLATESILYHRFIICLLRVEHPTWIAHVSSPYQSDILSIVLQVHKKSKVLDGICYMRPLHQTLPMESIKGIEPLPSTKMWDKPYHSALFGVSKGLRSLAQSFTGTCTAIIPYSPYCPMIYIVGRAQPHSHKFTLALV